MGAVLGPGRRGDVRGRPEPLPARTTADAGGAWPRRTSSRSWASATRRCNATLGRGDARRPLSRADRPEGVGGPLLRRRWRATRVAGHDDRADSSFRTVLHIPARAPAQHLLRAAVRVPRRTARGPGRGHLRARRGRLRHVRLLSGRDARPAPTVSSPWWSAVACRTAGGLPVRLDPEEDLRSRRAMGGWWRRWFGRRRGEDLETLRRRYERFQHLLDGNNRVLELIADAGEKLGGDHLFDRQLPGVADGRAREHRERGRVRPQRDDRRPIPRSGRRLRADPRARAPRPHPGAGGGVRAGAPPGAGRPRSRRRGRREDGDARRAAAEARPPGPRRVRGLGLGVPPPLPGEWAGQGDLAPGGEAGPRRGRAWRRWRRPCRRWCDGRPRTATSRARYGARSGRRNRAGSTFAVRSSALGEDAEHSFAGQHETLLNVPASDAVEAWREVVASLFSARRSGTASSAACRSPTP